MGGHRTFGYAHEMVKPLAPSMRREAGRSNRSWLPYARRLRTIGGFTALFHGPSGSGQSVAARTLAKQMGRRVYKVEPSDVLAKYIGETEKNLDALLRKAAANGWILFFDEADALFGKRSRVKDSHDRFANLDSGYLLQTIEKHGGVAILATNDKQSIDAALLRRVSAVVAFPAR